MTYKKLSEKDKSTSKKAKAKKSDDFSFPIVGIGASAGGLETLEQFFSNVPKNSGLAFVVIQHLDPNHRGMMPELLQRTTQMKVLQVTDKLQVKPNHVYVIPPNTSMSVLNGILHLMEPVKSHGLKLPIDYFFRSLADDSQEKSIGVILSGTGSDGSLGLKAIKEKNGIVAVQDPSTAKFDGMPQSAVNAVVADILAPASQLPEKLITFLKNSPAIKKESEIDIKSKSNLEKIVILLREKTGHDFSLYKKNSFYRRVERRMNVHQINKIAHYVRFLQENNTEIDILFKELLIGVTNFFRNLSVWEKFKEEVLPDMFNKAPNGHVFRAWVSACSTGEEAYSLAIVFQEACQKAKQNKNFKLQIFATDIDKDAIERGRKGWFSANITSDVSPERLNQFFVKDGDGFRISSSIREMVVFAPHNIIKEPPFTKLDMLLCRNLLIYMESELQIKLMNLFHYALNPGGVMLLGSAENESSHNKLFLAIDAKLKIYKSSASTDNNSLVDFPGSYKHPIQISRENIMPVITTNDIQSHANELMLQHFAPASVIINTDGDILYITGRTGKYLEPAAGKANMNIYVMAREGLQSELPGAIRKTKQSYEPVKLHNLKVGANGGTQIVDITLQLIDEPEALKGRIIIVFTDVTVVYQPLKSKAKSKNKNENIQEQKLKNELNSAKEELKNTREDMQATKEELQSINEEMQSKNEELQSANEELTTSQEEMQSLNEELHTVNSELKNKISDNDATSSDMRNLLNSTDIATLFLDKELNIRRYTEKTTKIFKLRQTDLGRPFTEIVSNLDYPEITDHANEVLKTLVFKETEIITNDHRWFTIRIMPYRTIDDRIDGLVITFIENTQHLKAINELHELKNYFEQTLQNSNVILAVCDKELRYTWMFSQIPDFDVNKVIGKRDNEIANDVGTLELMKLKEKVLESGKRIRANILFQLNDKPTPFHIIAQPLRDKRSDIIGVSTYASECICENTHNAKKAN